LGDKAAEMNIITKIPALEQADAYVAIKESLISSADKLNVETIPIALLHKASEMTAYGGNAIEGLARLKEEGLVRHIGASVYTPEEVRSFLEIDELDVIEIPINIFDLRLIELGLLDELASRGKIILARSVFLQGLFFLKPSGLPIYLAEAGQPLEDLMTISRETKIDIPQLAISFVKDIPEIDSLVIGAESAGQLEQNITLMSSPRLSNGIRQRILETFRNLPEGVINPSMWK